MQPYIYSVIIYDSQEMEATQVSFDMIELERCGTYTECNTTQPLKDEILPCVKT